MMWSADQSFSILTITIHNFNLVEVTIYYFKSSIVWVPTLTILTRFLCANLQTSSIQLWHHVEASLKPQPEPLRDNPEEVAALQQHEEEEELVEAEEDLQEEEEEVDNLVETTLQQIHPYSD